jgi:hypothetical protein
MLSPRRSHMPVIIDDFATRRNGSQRHGRLVDFSIVQISRGVALRTTPAFVPRHLEGP